jgi:hypothetical protein
MPNFAGKAETAVDALRDGAPQTIDENEFIDASRLVYDGVSYHLHSVFYFNASITKTSQLFFEAFA